jgi:flavodoxin
MKSLVVFYSLTGKTKLVSKAIAEELNATLVEIEEMKSRKPGFLTYLTGGFASVTNRESAINPIDIDLKQYDRLFIGSPIWASRPTPAINSFIYKTNFEGKNVVPFFTMGGNNSDKAFRNITTKIERRKGIVIGSFAIRSYNSTDNEIIAKTKKVIKSYSN